ncbi:MAG: hypothetical protein BGO31_07710 [Bacteroidetes bacterium 43-16]|nr:MAG: hypothetical protein BGO31_07710 [Bacteroidetes bacterium 43-16]
MNLQKKYPLPEFVLLDGDNHIGEQLLERTVLLHIPSQSIFEVVGADPENMQEFKDTNHFPFVFTNIDGEDEHNVLLLHASNANDKLADIYVSAANWYGNYANWIDGEIDNL